MNIIEPGVVLSPNTTKLIHCKACDTTWADKKTPKVCPHCGADKGKLENAKEAECESFMEEYMEMMASLSEEDSGNYDSEDGSDLESPEGYSEESVEEYGDAPVEEYGGEIEISSDSSADQTTDSYEADYTEETYEPIGYDPDEFANNMTKSPKLKKEDKLKYISDAEIRIRETKWALQRCGLPTDALQSVTQDVKQQADKLGTNIPGYVDLMLKMVVDSTVQRELRHPRKNRSYSLPDVRDMLRELEIRESCWDSYYNVAGLAG